MTSGNHVLIAKLTIESVRSVTEGRQELQRKLQKLATEGINKGGSFEEMVAECQSGEGESSCKTSVSISI